MDTFAIAEALAAAEDDDAAENGLGALFLNNDPRSTTQCVAYLRALGATTQFVSRGAAADARQRDGARARARGGHDRLLRPGRWRSTPGIGRPGRPGSRPRAC